LRQHPQVWLPPIKEIHYFDRAGRPYLLDGLARNAQKRYLFRRWVIPALADLRQSPSNLGWHIRFFTGLRTPTWYHSLFHPEADQITGDITPSYSVLPEAKIAQVAQLLPTTKLILLLRDPLERIWSHAAMYFSRYGQRGLAATPRAAIVAFLNRPDAPNGQTISQSWRAGNASFTRSSSILAFMSNYSAIPCAFFKRFVIFWQFPPSFRRISPRVFIAVPTHHYPPGPLSS
jgi:hypothetical protein